MDLLMQFLAHDGTSLLLLGARLALDLAAVSVLVRLVYKRTDGGGDCVLTYYLLNVLTLCLCVFLSRIETHVGFALALFGVFGILRYRTETIPIRDLTYLFVVIGMGVLNALARGPGDALELVAVNVVVVALAAFLELRSAKSSTRTLPMLYDKLELLRPENKRKLIDDIAEKTGLAVLSIDINRVDLLRDAAEVTVTHRRSG